MRIGIVLHVYGTLLDRTLGWFEKFGQKFGEPLTLKFGAQKANSGPDFGQLPDLTENNF